MQAYLVTYANAYTIHYDCRYRGGVRMRAGIVFAMSSVRCKHMPTQRPMLDIGEGQARDSPVIEGLYPSACEAA